MTLTSEDRVEIDALYARYSFAYDSGDADGYAALFSADGEFIRTGEPAIVGRDAIRAMVIEGLRTTPGVTHHTTGTLITADGDGAHGRAYCLVFRVMPDKAPRLRNLGNYEDRLVRTEEGWRFSRREFTTRLQPETMESEMILPTGDEDTRDLVNRYFAYLNEERWDDLRALLCDDCEVRAVGARARSGPDEAIGYFQRAFAGWRTHIDLPEHLIISGDRVVAEVRFDGISIAGVELSFNAVDIFTFRDGRIARLTSWYDGERVKRQLAAGQSD